MLTIALPNGTLQKMILEFFLAIGIKLPAPTRQHWVKISHDLISQIVWARPQHIPEMVRRGVVDLGITGLDCYYEWLYWVNPLDEPVRTFCRSAQWGLGEGIDDSLHELREKATGRVQIVLVGDKTREPLGFYEFLMPGVPVFTEFPYWTRRVLQPRAEVVASYGSVEALVPKVYPYGITVVDTGNSLRLNDLHVVKELHESKNKVFIRPKSELTGEAWQYAVNLLAAKLFGFREFDSRFWEDWK